MNKKNHPHLRVVTLEGRFEVPRRYAQSTSGRISSRTTSPSLSRDKEIAKPSRTRSPVESTLRKYPTDVLQRSAYDSCCTGLSELRYRRREGYASASMDGTLPMGNVLSIPPGHLPIGKVNYAGGVSETLEQMLFSARRVRFEELVKAYGGPKTFADEVEQRLRSYPELADGLTSFMNASYISNATAGRKNIGEPTALQLEALFDKPKGWMSGDAFENFLVRVRRRRKTA